MISVDERFSRNKREMGETELEEGEACLYHDIDDTSIDPDIALSYLDEKLQNVLGHFKKDFEGLVSAENLGAKYGTYGSFLPAYRRSPVLSHSRSPSTVQSHNTQSLNISRVEGGHHNSSVQASVPHSMKHGSVSGGSAPLYKPPSQSVQRVQTASTQSMQSGGECTPKSEVRDQRTFKLRIKMGSDNLSVKKNADIYCGLGLDGSPSSSFDDSPAECEGLSGALPSDSHKSPTQILLMMTSSPLFGGYLLSPLPDHLVQLSERPRFMQDSKTSSVENKVKLLDGSSLQVKKDSESIQVGFDISVKETDIDALSYDELVCSALKLPLLAQADITLEDSTKGSSKENIHLDAPKREPLERMSIPVSASDKVDEKANSRGNIIDHTVVEAPKEMMIDSGKTSRNKGEIANSSTNGGFVGSKSKKGSKSGRKGPLRQKAEKSTTRGGGMGLPGRKEPSSSEKKSEVSGFVTRKVAMGSVNDIELEQSVKQNILGKAEDNYKDFFGDLNEEADIMDSPHVISGDKMKTSDIVEKAASDYEHTSKDRTSSFVAHREAIPGANLRVSSHNTSFSQNGQPVSEPAPGGVDTKDNWVCCDNCLKWRLLPPGKEDNLPEKWLCSMMTWLPDMNRCSISEEETTKAFRARYQLVAENPVSLHAPLDGLGTRMHSADTSGTIVPNDGVMLDKLRKTSKPSFQDSPNRIPSSMKKKQQSGKDRTLTEAKVSPLVNGSGFQQLPNSSETYVETNQPKRIHKHRADHESDGGHTKMSKVKSKRELDQELPRASKKAKMRSTPSGGNDWPAAHDLDNEMSGVNSGYGTFGKSRFQVEEFADELGTTNIAPKKRKKDSFQDPQNLTPSSVKLTPRSEQFSSKKHRISKSGEKLSSASKRDGKEDKRGKSISRRNLDGTESLRKRSSSAQPIVATTSSSSKISDSLKDKSKLQELKGSPVESVSSSPFRNSNGDKIILASKMIVDRDNVQDADKLITSSPRKSSDVDYGCCSDRYSSKRKDVINTGTHNGSVVPAMIDQKEKAKRGSQHKNGLVEKSPSKLHYGLSTNSCADSLDANDGYPSEARTSDGFVKETAWDEGHQNTNGSHQGKSWKDSPALCKDKKDKSNSQKGLGKMSESCDNQPNHAPVYEEKEKNSKVKVQDKLGSDSDKTEKDATFNNQEIIHKSKAQQDYIEKRPLKKIDVEKPEHLSTSASEKSRHLPPSDVKNETSNCIRPHLGNGVSTSTSEAHASDFPKELQCNRKADSHNGTHNTPSKHSMSNGQRLKNLDAPSPLRRDVSSNQAANSAYKEAKDLKHLADRLKNAGSAESTVMYFEAALKFLHTASLLESGNTENAKHGDMIQSMQLYSSTAKLCEFCAHEFEKSKDMAAAALAYKCMEVAYLRVIYSSHHSASRDRHELQNVLQMVPTGESPSSSASDIDNLNHSTTGDKAPQTRTAGSPYIAANLVIAARNRPNLSKLLSFAQDVSSSMEASRKSRVAFAAANVGMGSGDYKDAIASVKTALDFNFHDIEGLLRLVRLAKETTSH